LSPGKGHHSLRQGGADWKNYVKGKESRMCGWKRIHEKKKKRSMEISEGEEKQGSQKEGGSFGQRSRIYAKLKTS